LDIFHLAISAENRTSEVREAYLLVTWTG